jgi:hypothetical protein
VEPPATTGHHRRKRSGAEQLALLAALFLGVFYSRQVPVLGIVIGLGVGTYGAAILLNVRGMRARFLVPTGIERRPNPATPWITGAVYLFIVLALFGTALARL